MASEKAAHSSPTVSFSFQDIFIKMVNRLPNQRKVKYYCKSTKELFHLEQQILIFMFVTEVLIGTVWLD